MKQKLKTDLVHIIQNIMYLHHEPTHVQQKGLTYNEFDKIGMFEYNEA